jgi:ABC-type sugar transport system ATPase subunit
VIAVDDGNLTVASASPGATPGRSARSVLQLEHLSKTFPGTKALDDVSLDVAEGEIHALVGQNGSGKSTLVKVLAGYHRADPGSKAWLNGEPLEIAHAATRHDRLRFVHQDLGMFLELNAIDNLALRGDFARGPLGLISWSEQAELTRDLLGRFDLDFDIRRPMGEATPVQRTIVAIAAALAGWEGGPGVLVLDEPTAVLPPHDVDLLLGTVEQVRSRGTSILYISHRLDEVFRVADRVTVLRGGRVVGTQPVGELTTQTLAQLMVGSGVDAGFRAGLSYDAGAPVILRVRNASGRFLDNVDLELRAGEVLGIAGLPGSGSNELPYAIVGADRGATGELQLGGEWVPLRKAASCDIPIVPADRAREAIVGEFGVRENLSLSVLDRFRRFGWQLRRRENELVDAWMQTVEIKAAAADAPITSLSGGNQQKVAMARCLAREPRVLVLCEPTAGVDVGTRQAIYEFIASRSRAGLSLVVSSSDTGDLLAICTRVLVFINGRIAHVLVGDQLTEQRLLHAMEEQQ